MSETPTKQILRWLAVLPGAVLAGIIVLFPIHWAAMLIHYFGGSADSFITTEDGKGLLQSIPLESLERFLDALFVPGTIISVGARIAPRFHLATAIAATLLLVGGLAFLFVQLSSSGSHIVDSPFRLVVTAVLWIASVTFALFYARDLDKAANKSLHATAAAPGS